jgi:hypothetical protein
MKREQSKKKILTTTDHPLLSLKDVLDGILKEAEGLPSDVRQILVQARDVTWKAFVERHEQINSAVR